MGERIVRARHHLSDMTRKGRTRREPLSRLRILKAAVAFADEHGVEALTMRSVAEELGFRVMSLYNHVANKEEMLAGMVDVVVGEMRTPEASDDWKETMRTTAVLAHEVLLNHRWAASEWSRRMPGPERVRFMDWILQVLTEGGLEAEIVYRGYHAVTMHIIGFTLQEIGYEQMFADDFEALANEFLEGLGGAYPYMAEHVRAHLVDHEHGDEFSFVLDLILNGLERASATA